MNEWIEWSILRPFSLSKEIACENSIIVQPLRKSRDCHQSVHRYKFPVNFYPSTYLVHPRTYRNHSMLMLSGDVTGTKSLPIFSFWTSLLVMKHVNETADYSSLSSSKSCYKSGYSHPMPSHAIPLAKDLEGWFDTTNTITLSITPLPPLKIIHTQYKKVQKQDELTGKKRSRDPQRSG